MKDWLKNHYKGILEIVFCIVVYLVLFRSCIEYIDFKDYADDGYNINVAEFYFIILPFASVFPVLLYEVIKYIKNKRN